MTVGKVSAIDSVIFPGIWVGLLIVRPISPNLIVEMS